MRFTRENAASYARLANQARKANRRDIAEAMAKRLLDLTPPNPSYQQIRLARVRSQLDKLDAWILSEKDPQKLDRLASAQAKLAEQERQLAGRPMPGSLKPVVKIARDEAVELPTARESFSPPSLMSQTLVVAPDPHHSPGNEASSAPGPLPDPSVNDKVTDMQGGFGGGLPSVNDKVVVDSPDPTGIIHVEQYGQASVEIPTQGDVVSPGNEVGLMGGS